MAKVDLIAELEALGVTTTGVSGGLADAGITPISGEETNKELEALIEKVKGLLPEAPKSGDEDKKDDAGAAAPAKEAAPEKASASGSLTKAPKSGAVDVIRGTNTYIRTYSEEVHGEGYFELALEFVGKEQYATRGYRLVDSSLIKEVVVLYREKEDAEKSIDDQNPDAPMVDKERKFDDKDYAISFNIAKKGSIIVPSIR